MTRSLYQKGTIEYRQPDMRSLHEASFCPVDMHLHSCHSDGLPDIPEFIHYAEQKQIGLAITDHNEITGALKAASTGSDILLIPGIELETLEGPHLLCYFYTTDDLEDFFAEFTRRRHQETPGLERNLPVIECLTLAEPYDCLRVAAHPYGYYGINRGVLKCVDKGMLPGVMDHIDGIEVICGGMMKNLNQKAIQYAESHEIPFTGGSDAHILADVGTVVTAVQADTTEEFLTGIKRRENLVIGRPGSYINKGATAGVIAWSFVPYSLARLGGHYHFYKRRSLHAASSYRHRIQNFRKNNKSGESEERREEP